MKISRPGSFRIGIFALSSLALCISNAVAARPVQGLVSSTGNSVTADQISRAKEKMASAMAIADRFATEFTIGPNGALDPKRVQLINDLLSGDAQGLIDASSATSLQQAISVAHAAAVRKSNTTIAAGSHNAISPDSVGDTTDDLVYTPITPCRVVDTRSTSTPALVPLTVRTFSAAGSAAQGGGSCSGYPSTLAAIPAAMAFNVTADATGQGSPANSGFLSIEPQGVMVSGTVPATSWENFVGGQIVANSGVAAINPTNGEFDAMAQHSTYLVVDAFGYFTAPSGSGSGGGVSGGQTAFTSSMTASPVTVVLGGLLNTGAAMPVSGAELLTSPSVGVGPINLATAPLLLPLVQTFPQSGTFNTLNATIINTVSLTLLSPTTLTITLYTGTPSGGSLTLNPTGLTCSITYPGVSIGVGVVKTCTQSAAGVSVQAGDSGLIVIQGTGLLATVLTVAGSVAIAP